MAESALNKTLEPHGFSYPEFVGPVTWGGLAASNTSGRSVDPCWGKPGDYLMGLEVALPTGEVIWTGTRSHRRPCGIDLTRLFAGFQAMAGVITNLRLRLVPTPRNTRWGVVYIPTVEDAGRAVARLYRQGVPPPRLMELMDDQFLELGGLANEDRDAVILIGTDGWTAVEAQAKLDAIFEVARAEGSAKNGAGDLRGVPELRRLPQRGREGGHDQGARTLPAAGRRHGRPARRHGPLHGGGGPDARRDVRPPTPASTASASATSAAAPSTPSSSPRSRGSSTGSRP